MEVGVLSKRRICRVVRVVGGSSSRERARNSGGVCELVWAVGHSACLFSGSGV